ncbi:hypothetical protein D3C87_1324710 [compost metagenome]
MVTIAGNLGVLALLAGHGDAGHDRFLTNIEMAKAADQAHAIHLAGLFLEAADQQHLAKRFEILFLGELGDIGLRLGLGGRRLARHSTLRLGRGNCRFGRSGHFEDDTASRLAITLPGNKHHGGFRALNLLR